MLIDKITIKNFRLLNDSTLDLKEDLSLLIGKNNSGKTSFLVLFEKFYENIGFNYDDFSLCLRDELLEIHEGTDINNLSIKMILEIKYNENDNLEHLSEFIIDLDPEVDNVKILFECSINKQKLLSTLGKIESNERKRFIEKNLSSFLERKYYIFERYEEIKQKNRESLIEKDLNSIKRLINFQIIHAKRPVASSEENKQNKRILSSLTNNYFNNNNSPDGFNKINELMIQMDGDLDQQYAEFFEGFLRNSKEFLSLSNLKVISNIQSNELLNYSSQVVYGFDNNDLPENLNGLGYMNILYLLLSIEIKKENFKRDMRDINLLFIEEPEAHTHPQMQYVFARKIKKLLSDITNLQTIITTHSSHIVSECDFKDIRYLMKINSDQKHHNIEIKNFYKELEHKYSNPQDFRFIKQFLTIQSAELFFSDKVIFIEGTTERILLPYFINILDSENEQDDSYVPISSQNISVLEAGANAKSFLPFLDFLNIKTLIITDIDTTKPEVKKDKNDKEKTSYTKCKVKEAQSTSNQTLKELLGARELKIGTKSFSTWLNNLINGKNKSIRDHLMVAYQTNESNYHGRSFEDAFISLNIDIIKEYRDQLLGLKNLKELDNADNFYQLTEDILDKKSDFASSILYLGLSNKKVEWKIPAYIREGLSWIAN